MCKNHYLYSALCKYYFLHVFSRVPSLSVFLFKTKWILTECNINCCVSDTSGSAPTSLVPLAACASSEVIFVQKRRGLGVTCRLLRRNNLPCSRDFYTPWSGCVKQRVPFYCSASGGKILWGSSDHRSDNASCALVSFQVKHFDKAMPIGLMHGKMAWGEMLAYCMTPKGWASSRSSEGSFNLPAPTSG